MASQFLPRQTVRQPTKNEADSAGGGPRSPPWRARRQSAGVRALPHPDVLDALGNDRFTADTMEYDNLDQVLQLHGRVRGVLMPTPAK